MRNREGENYVYSRGEEGLEKERALKRKKGDRSSL